MPAGRHPRAQVVVTEQVAQPVVQDVGVAYLRGDHHGLAVGEVRVRGGVGAAGDQRREAVVQRGEQRAALEGRAGREREGRDVGGLQRGRDLAGGAVPGDRHAVGRARPGDVRGQLVAERRGLVLGQGERGEPAEHQQVQPRTLGRQARDGVDEVAQALHRVHEAEEDDELGVRGHAEGAPGGGPVGGVRVDLDVRQQRGAAGLDAETVPQGRGVLAVGREHRRAARDEAPGLAVGEATALEERPHAVRHPGRPRPPAVLVQRRHQRHPREVAEQARGPGEPERRRRELHVRDVRPARAQRPRRAQQPARPRVHGHVDDVHAVAVEGLREVDGVVGDAVVRGVGAPVDERDAEVSHPPSVPDPGRSPPEASPEAETHPDRPERVGRVVPLGEGHLEPGVAVLLGGGVEGEHEPQDDVAAAGLERRGDLERDQLEAPPLGCEPGVQPAPEEPERPLGQRRSAGERPLRQGVPGGVAGDEDLDAVGGLGPALSPSAGSSAGSSAGT